MLKSISLSLIISTLVVYSGYSLATKEKDLPELVVNYSQLNTFAKKEIECLADNIFFEAAYEPQKGQIGVAFVTMNRVNSNLFPNTICEVVKQKTPRVCQFSWYCEEKPRRQSYTKNLTERQKIVYNEIEKLAIHFYANHEKWEDPTKGAIFYHADYVNPRWKNVIKTVVIGRHIFYVKDDV